MDKVIYLSKNDIYSTLTTYFYCHFWMMWAAEQIGIDSYIDCPKGLFLQSYNDADKYREIPNGFEWYFKQPKIENPPPKSECEVWTWEHNNWDATIDVSKYQFMSQPLNVIKDYYKKNLIFNDETNRRGQILVDKYGIDFKKTIGITWRGSDIYLESLNGNSGRKYTPIELYYKWIDKALEVIPDARIACTSEEEEILEPLFKRYPQAFLIEEFYQVPKGSKHNPERFSPMSGYERGLQPALMVWLFSKCAWLIKNRASTSAVASWISDGEIVNICHTEVLGFPPHLEGIEYKGQIYPI
jgi:hypothetical protein